MPVALALSGWLLGLAALGALVRVRGRLARNLEAVARACHEVRGPLTAVRLGLEPPQSAPRLPSGRLRAMELELGRAKLALDDLSALGAGSASAEVSAPAELVDVAELLRDCVEAWTAAAATHRVRLRLRAGGPGPWVAGERLRLAQAVENLLANAIEHGGGEVEVGLRAGPDSIRIEVSDGGPGLPAPIDQLIRRRGGGRDRGRAGRGRGRDGRGRGRAARGHGLAIASGVAHAHGGRLTAAPSERGARMALELPAAPVAARMP